MKPINYIIGLLLFFLALLAGIILPELDLEFSVSGFIVHRSAITHSILVPLIWYHLTGRRKRRINRFIGMGLFLGVAVYLSYYFYPVVFEGGSPIFFPLLGSFEFLSPAISTQVATLVTLLWFLGNIYWGVEYYFKLITSGTGFQLFSFISIVLAFYGFSYFSGLSWVMPAIIFAAAVVAVKS